MNNQEHSCQLPPSNESGNSSSEDPMEMNSERIRKERIHRGMIRREWIRRAIIRREKRLFLAKIMKFVPKDNSIVSEMTKKLKLLSLDESSTTEVKVQLDALREIMAEIGNFVNFLVFDCSDTDLLLSFSGSSISSAGFVAEISIPGYSFNRSDPNLQYCGFQLDRRDFITTLKAEDELIIKLSTKLNMVACNYHEQGFKATQMLKLECHIPSITKNNNDFRVVVEMSASKFSEICSILKERSEIAAAVITVTKDRDIVFWAVSSIPGNDPIKMEQDEFIVLELAGYASSPLSLSFCGLFKLMSQVSERVTICFSLKFGVVIEYKFSNGEGRQLNARFGFMDQVRDDRQSWNYSPFEPTY